MATLTATAAASTAVPRQGINSTTRVVSFTIPGTALSAGDVIQMLKVPKNAVIGPIAVGIDCTAQSYTLTSIGDGNTTNRYHGSQSLVLKQNVFLTGGGLGYQYSAEDTIDLVVGTITSGTAADAVITLAVTYTMDR